MSVSNVISYRDSLSNKSDNIYAALGEKFSVHSFLDDARKSGFEISDNQWDAYIARLSKSKIRLELISPINNDPEDVNSTELDMVYGGLRSGWVAANLYATINVAVNINAVAWANAAIATEIAAAAAVVAFAGIFIE